MAVWCVDYVIASQALSTCHGSHIYGHLVWRHVSFSRRRSWGVDEEEVRQGSPVAARRVFEGRDAVCPVYSAP